MSRCAIEGWITIDSAKKLFRLGGQDFEALMKAAVTREFKPVNLNAKASLEVKNTLRTVDSRNVIARLEGSDPTLKDEYVIYMAHWDHFGRDPKLKGDQILNGAVDPQSCEVVIRTDQRLNAQSTIELFKMIEQKHPNAENIYTIADNARYYRSSQVQQYLANSRIKLIFLPTYSPNLNLIERLWKYFRKMVLCRFSLK
jgi:hypothetical protein